MMLLNLLKKLLFPGKGKGVVLKNSDYTIDIFTEDRGWVRYEDYHGLSGGKWL